MKLRESLLGQGALSVKIVTLLDKAERRTCEIKPDYCCFQVSLSILLPLLLCTSAVRIDAVLMWRGAEGHSEVYYRQGL